MARNNTFLLEGVVGSPGSGVTAREYGDKYNHTTILNVQSVFPAIAGGASLGVGKLVYTLPAGACVVGPARLKVLVNGAAAIAADTPDVGLGTTIASGAVAVLGGTAAFENILTGQTMTDCDGTETDAIVTTELAIAANGAHTVYLNIADGWAAGGDPALDVNAVIILPWRYQGD
jgi:hypothetical protein